MTPGPILIKQCKRCLKSFSESTLGSGNTFGATFWTDGKIEAPMLPDTPDLVKCPHCGQFLWIAKASVVEEIDPFHSGDAWPDIPSYEELTEAEYLEALKMGIAKTKSQQIRTRICAWWKANDPLRDSHSPEQTGHSAATVENMRALFQLLAKEEGDYQRITMAELARELGDFQAAQQILTARFSDDKQDIVRKISELITKRDTRVASLEFD